MGRVITALCVCVPGTAPELSRFYQVYSLLQAYKLNIISPFYRLKKKSCAQRRQTTSLVSLNIRAGIEIQVYVYSKPLLSWEYEIILTVEHQHYFREQNCQGLMSSAPALSLSLSLSLSLTRTHTHTHTHTHTPYNY